MNWTRNKSGRAPVNPICINARRGDERFTIKRATGAVQESMARQIGEACLKHAYRSIGQGRHRDRRLGAFRAVKKNCVATGSDFAHAALNQPAH